MKEMARVLAQVATLRACKGDCCPSPRFLIAATHGYVVRCVGRAGESYSKLRAKAGNHPCLLVTQARSTKNQTTFVTEGWTGQRRRRKRAPPRRPQSSLAVRSFRRIGIRLDFAGGASRASLTSRTVKAGDGNLRQPLRPTRTSTTLWKSYRRSG